MTKTLETPAVRVRGRFHRSVQLAKDWEGRADLSGYLVTPTVRDLARRLLGELALPDGVRAWSLTGPYGTGKSSFALFLSRLLAGQADAHPDAPAFADLRTKKPLLPVLLVGQRAPLAQALSEALATALGTLEPDLFTDLGSNDSGPDNAGPDLTDDAVVKRFETAAERVQAHGYGGLIVILDEFGKFLEYSAQGGGDLLIMQSLAEAASRSAAPFVLMTVLHTGFAEYLDRFDEVRRAEWQKVQGRFTDVAFQEPPEQLLKLLGTALEARFPDDVSGAYAREVDTCLSAAALTEARARLPLADLLPACAPLHPLTALLLWPLFRGKFAQNERSLFSFLTSHEPFGLQEFLRDFSYNREADAPFYRLPTLYDYVKTSLGAGLYRGEAGRRWAELADALERLGADAPERSADTLKTLGLLWLYGGPVGLRATGETLALAVGDDAGVEAALGYLERTSTVVFRRFEGAYGLWEGSDVDLEALFRDARQQLGRGNLAERLTRTLELRPVVARAHYIRTGTLRFFPVTVVDDSANLAELLAADATGDGRIVYVLNPGGLERTRQALVETAKILTADLDPTRKPVVLAVPGPLAGLEDALAEVECWRFVQANTPALAGDRVARRELEVRLEHAEERLAAVAGAAFGLRGHRFDPAALTWVYRGEMHELGDSRAFSSWLSRICGEVYAHAAPLHNELLNRETLSSAAKAALNRLIKLMVETPGEHRFGVPGTPPEVSMYESLFAAGGFHREVAQREAATGWAFAAPNEAWAGVWGELEAFLETTKTGRRPLLELYHTLKSPPYGLREGPLPLLMCALLLTKKDDVVLYYNGLFQPELFDETLELLVRVPESFEVQQLDLGGEGRAVLEAVGTALGSLALGRDDTGADGSPLLRLVKPLVVSVARLPPFSRGTLRLEPPEAADLRNAVLRAKDPYALLFTDLPRILGVDAVSDPAGFAEKLRRALWALQRAFPLLLDTLETSLKNAFDLPGETLAELQENLRRRAEPLRGYASDPALVLFINEAARGDLPNSTRDWREALGRVVLKGKPPTTWNDADLMTFQVNLTRLASDFVRLEELVAEKHRTGAGQIFRVGVLSNQVREVRGTVALHDDRLEDVDKLSSKLLMLLKEYEVSADGDRVRLAALAQTALKFLGGERPESDD